jgi:hypothetical protein
MLHFFLVPTFSGEIYVGLRQKLEPIYEIGSMDFLMGCFIFADFFELKITDVKQ